MSDSIFILVWQSSTGFEFSIWSIINKTEWRKFYNFIIEWRKFYNFISVRQSCDVKVNNMIIEWRKFYNFISVRQSCDVKVNNMIIEWRKFYLCISVWQSSDAASGAKRVILSASEIVRMRHHGHLSFNLHLVRLLLTIQDLIIVCRKDLAMVETIEIRLMVVLFLFFMISKAF